MPTQPIIKQMHAYEVEKPIVMDIWKEEKVVKMR